MHLYSDVFFACVLSASSLSAFFAYSSTLSSSTFLARCICKPPLLDFFHIFSHASSAGSVCKCSSFAFGRASLTCCLATSSLRLSTCVFCCVLCLRAFIACFPRAPFCFLCALSLRVFLARSPFFVSSLPLSSLACSAKLLSALVLFAVFATCLYLRSLTYSSACFPCSPCASSCLLSSRACFA